MESFSEATKLAIEPISVIFPQYTRIKPFSIAPDSAYTLALDITYCSKKSPNIRFVTTGQKTQF